MITNVDAIQLFDLDLGRPGKFPDLHATLGGKSQSDAYSRYDESFLWLFDPQLAPRDEDSPTGDQPVAYLAEDVNCPHSLPGFDRFSLESDPDDPSDRGGVISISKSQRVAVVCIWKRYGPGGKPLDVSYVLEIKHALGVNIPPQHSKQLSVLFPHVVEAELMYPFLAVRYDSADLQEVLARDGVGLGRLFSGGRDHEADETLRGYLKDNLSLRRYEGLFLRTSDGLGVYTSRVENSPEKDLLLYERTVFRAVQVCELCLLEHRLARSFKMRVDDDARKVRTFPRPFLVEMRRTELLTLEMGVKALPFRTPEAPTLVGKAQHRFSIPERLREAKDSYDFLETRYQNTKTTALAIVAVVAYIFDKMGVWKGISHLIQSYGHLVFDALGHHH